MNKVSSTKPFQKAMASLALAAAMTTLFSITAFGADEKQSTSVLRTHAPATQAEIKLPLSASLEAAPWRKPGWPRNAPSEIWPWLSADPAEQWSLLIRSMNNPDRCTPLLRKPPLHEAQECAGGRTPIEPRGGVS